MAKRTTPNSYFAWYNDHDKIAIVCKQQSSNSSKGTTSGEYDTFLDTGNLNGTITNMITDGSTVTVTCASHGLATSDKITISSSALYDGDYTVTVTDDDTFTFASSDVAATADTISSLAVSSGTATATTSAAHGYSVGDVVYIDAANNTYDEQVTITSVADSTHFTYTTSEGDVSTSGVVGDTGSWVSLFVDEGLRLVIHSKYETLSAVTDDLQTNGKLDSTMHAFVLDYVKSRMLEDMGQVEPSQYFRTKYENGIQKKPTRKSGVRTLLVPNL